MKFDIQLSRSTIEALKRLRKFDQQRIRDALVAQLSLDPLAETRNRKKLRANGLAQWELRVGKYRVFYKVLQDENVVQILALGYKEGNKLLILDEEFES
jgi:mRNA-degrading endonuclease RelE of RelBE toxin-antitoxin system